MMPIPSPNSVQPPRRLVTIKEMAETKGESAKQKICISIITMKGWMLPDPLSPFVGICANRLAPYSESNKTCAPAAGPCWTGKYSKSYPLRHSPAAAATSSHPIRIQGDELKRKGHTWTRFQYKVYGRY